MVLALNFFQAVAHGREEIVIGADDGAVGFELDHGRRAIDGSLPGESSLQLLTSRFQGLLEGFIEHDVLERIRG